MFEVWFSRPQWHWFGFWTLCPVMFSWDDYERRCMVLGWSVTGRMVIAFGRKKYNLPLAMEAERIYYNKYFERGGWRK